MKAFALTAYGQPLRAGGMPVPTPGPHEVLVKVAAAGVNHADERTRTGEFKAVFRLDLPKVMGGELSGEVVAVGERVTEFAVGDRVYGYTGVVGMGAWAEVVDVVVDTQGGDITARSLEVVRPGGIVVGIAGTPEPSLADQAGAGPLVKLALAAMSLKLRRRAAKLGVRYRFLFIRPDGAALRRIAALVDQGVLAPVVDRVLPFEQTLAALDRLLSGGARGKILVATSASESTTTH